MAIASFNLATTSDGVPAGASIPNQTLISKFGSASLIVGAPGASGDGCNEVTPSNLSFPAWMPAVIGALEVVSSIFTSPVVTASVDGAEPL